MAHALPDDPADDPDPPVSKGPDGCLTLLNSPGRGDALFALAGLEALEENEDVALALLKAAADIDSDYVSFAQQEVGFAKVRSGSTFESFLLERNR